VLSCVRAQLRAPAVRRAVTRELWAAGQLGSWAAGQLGSWAARLARCPVPRVSCDGTPQWQSEAVRAPRQTSTEAAVTSERLSETATRPRTTGRLAGTL